MPATDLGQRDELRFAVVLNGGVSLAVWIGGVTLEIDRLTRRDRVYGQLLDLLDLEARADVITGTSAGGINGAALALAQVNDKADLRRLRDLWADQGRMETLLRTPFRGEPGSLLKGDEYFLPSLEQAIRGLTNDYTPLGAERRPIHLGVTATLLNGVRKLQTDALGQALPQEIHAGLMTFRHLEGRDAPDDFSAEAVAETVRRLALAARSSASFPVAFEPSFVPVGSTTPDPLKRPDMAGVASWADELSPDDQSRYAVDGGAMMNTPTRPAMQVIDQLPATSAVRRVMLLIFPHAPVDFVQPASTVDDPPTVVDSLLGASGATRNEASRTHVELVDEHNRRAAERRTGRADALVSLQQSALAKPTSVDRTVHLLAVELFAHYRELRLRRAVRDLAGRIPGVPGWSYDRVLAAADRAQTDIDRVVGLPYVPKMLGQAIEPDPGWPWGVTTAEHIVDDAQDLLRRLVRMRLPDADRELVGQHRARLFVIKDEIDGVREAFNSVWNAAPLRGLEPDEAYWKARLRAQRLAYLGGPPLTAADLVGFGPGDVGALLAALNGAFAPQGLGRRVNAALDTLAQSLVRLRPVVERAVATASGDNEVVLAAWSSVIATGSAGTTGLLTALVELDVVVSTLTSAAEGGSEHPIELVQVSLQTQNAFARITTAGADKLGGARLKRFAGFLKESWRINDWMWGRLDAATMLCRVLLDPERLRRARAEDAARGGSDEWPPTADEWVDLWIGRLFPGAKPGTGFAGKRREAIWEVTTYVYADDPSDLPPTLEALAALFAWAVQADVVSEDLPALRNAVLADRREGASQSSSGERLVEEQAALISQLAALPQLPLASNVDTSPRSTEPDEADVRRRELGLAGLVAFDRAGVGREALDREASGDLLIRTGVTALAVGATLLDSPKLGFPPAKPLTRAIRGVALLPYWVTRGLTGSGRIVQALAMLALALGAAMLALSLVFAGTPRWMLLVGVSAALFALGYAALRTGSFLHGLVLLSPVVPLATFAVAEQLQGDDGPAATVSVLPIVLALIVGVLALGSLPGLVRSPFGMLVDRSRANAWSAVVVLVVLVVLVVPLAVALLESGTAAVRLGVGVTVVLVVVAALAYHLSSGFRVRYYGTDPGAPAPGREGWRTAPVVQPVGVATAWACVYAAAFAYVGAWLLVAATHSSSAPSASVLDGDLGWSVLPSADDLSPLEWTMWVSTLAAWVFALVLVVAVVLLPWRGHVRIRTGLEGEVLGGQFRLGPTPAMAEADLLARLAARGTTYAYLTKVESDVPPPAGLRPSRTGGRLADRLRTTARP